MPAGRPRKVTSPPTISEVAAEAGVARATAARALGAYGSVSEDSRRRVLAAAERIGYRPNTLARSMSTGVTRTVGIVVGDIANPFFAALARGVCDELRAVGVDCLVASTDEDIRAEEEIVEALVRKQVDGIIVASTAGSGRRAEHLESARGSGRGVPVVLVDRTLDTFEAPAVVLDNVGAAKAATELLIAAGHRRIGLVWGPFDAGRPAERVPGMLSTAWERFVGYRDALADAGIALDDLLVAPQPANLADVAGADDSTLLVGPDRPSALVATESDATLRVLHRLRELGLTCPRDVSLVGFDDAPWTDLTDPPLSVVRQPAFEMGRLAGERLKSLMAGEQVANTATVLPAKLLSRASVAAPG